MRQSGYVVRQSWLPKAQVQFIAEYIKQDQSCDAVNDYDIIPSQFIILEGQDILPRWDTQKLRT